MISIDWTIGLQFVNFVVLMLVLNFILYRPLRDMLNRRKETIDGSLQAAKDLEGQVDEKMSRYQQQLQEAKLKASQDRAVLRQEAAKEEAAILAKAQGKAADELKVIKNRVAAEAEEARKVLGKETKALAAGIASKVLGREVK